MPGVTGEDAVEVRLLGPLELIQDGLLIELKGPSERALVALLATEPGRVFSPDRLIDALWGESLPANPANALHLRVSKLRKAIGEALVRHPAGYRLDIDAEAVDAVLFTRLVAKRAFADALALWRGAPLEEFMEYEWARAEAARLEELRATAIEEHTDARLAAGEHVDLVAELEGLVAAAFLRERLRGQLMVALYRCGRTADALAAYQSFRRLLNDELGIDPSGDLRRLEEAILRDDPSLAAPATASPVSTNLPAPLSSLIGRDADLQRLDTMVSRARLVTLTGPGGVGKTTLAIAAGRQATAAHRDGVWFVPLASVTDGRGIPGAVAEALGVADPDSSSPQRLVASWLAHRQVLLLLDNCEHLVDPCAHFVEQLLRATGDGVRIVATSREALGVPGELQMPVAPLDAAEAVVLFAERATSIAPEFDLGSNREHVRRICERLDGMPLAIELAAARVKTLEPEEIAARLDDRFRLLTSGPRTAEARHKTLRATVDWSHALLDRDEQVLFRRVAVFRGGWTLAAAEAVCGEPDGEDVLDVLSRLVDRSLVVAEAGRFRMLETIRAYAEERIDEVGERSAQARRHAAFFADFAARAEAKLRGPDQRAWLDRLRVEEANLRQALDWARGEDSDLALRLAGSLGWYWYVGRQVDGRAYVSAALDASAGGSDAARARALQALSLAVRPVGCIVHPTPVGARAAEESLALFRRVNDAAGGAMSQLLAAVEGVGPGDTDRYLDMVEQARATLQSCGDAWGVALADFVEMEIRLHHGQVEAALVFGHEASRAFDALDDDWGRSAVMLHLGYGLRIAGRVDEAEDILQRAVVLSRAGGLPNNLARSFIELGEARVYRGDASGAQPWFAECAEIARDLGNDTLLALAALGRGAAGRLRGDTAEAARDYRQALSLSRGADFGRGVLRARIGLAAARLDDDVTSDVRQELEAARADAEALGDVGLMVSASEQLARAAALMGERDAWQGLLAEAQTLRSTAGRPRGALDHRDALAAHVT
jgi:predicted ATPase/DNA-binding SARP family transcriptional activator